MNRIPKFSDRMMFCGSQWQWLILQGLPLNWPINAHVTSWLYSFTECQNLVGYFPANVSFQQGIPLYNINRHDKDVTRQNKTGKGMTKALINSCRTSVARNMHTVQITKVPSIHRHRSDCFNRGTRPIYVEITTLIAFSSSIFSSFWQNFRPDKRLR